MAKQSKEDIVFTVVGTLTLPHPGRYTDIDKYIEAANNQLANGHIPMRITNAEHAEPGSEVFVKQLADAESMLLDWLSDAEIGEFSYIVLYEIDKARAEIRKRIMQGTQLDQALANIQVARVTQARFVKMVHDMAVRHGRPPIGDHEYAVMQEDGDSAEVR
jgi:hypothetical protein